MSLLAGESWWDNIISSAFPWVDQLISYFEGLFRIIEYIFDPFVYAYQVIAGAGETILSIGSYMPSIIGASCMIVFACAVIKFIIGR